MSDGLLLINLIANANIRDGWLELGLELPNKDVSGFHMVTLNTQEIRHVARLTHSLVVPFFHIPTVT